MKILPDESLPLLAGAINYKIHGCYQSDIFIQYAATLCIYDVLNIYLCLCAARKIYHTTIPAVT